ncbi:hypothetical protein C5167_019603 [Papaver somniferum]|uniref:Protein kinase domain-containing protein n=1 Tax=Papaver somniferum TaxID=3469 RepID=A0A4Y7ISR2_PAPSO|nr:hypothetical protein C5167_019603 [Papaver somniferum]
MDLCRFYFDFSPTCIGCGPERDEQGRPDGNKYNGSIYMVFEYMDHDLTGLADQPGMRFTIPQIKPEQLNKIYELCGAPDEVNWPGVSKIPWYNNFKPSSPMTRPVREVFKHFDRHALELLEKMPTLDPSQVSHQFESKYNHVKFVAAESLLRRLVKQAESGDT